MRVGVIGTNWGRIHIDAFRTAGADVAALCGRDERKTRSIADSERVPFATTNVEELCERVDVVVVASADKVHVEHVRAALKAKKPVLCEKPLAMDAGDAEAIARDAAAAGVPAAVCFPFRMIPAVVGLRRWLEGRRVRSLELVFRNGFLRGPTDGSGDFGGASHVVDAALFLTRGRPERVVASRGGNHLSLLLELNDGGRAVLVHRPSAEPGTWGSWSLHGEEWEAGFSAGFRPSEHGWVVTTPRVYERGEWRDLDVGSSSELVEPWAAAHVEVARAFISVVRGATWPEQLATFEEGASVQRVLDGARGG